MCRNPPDDDYEEAVHFTEEEPLSPEVALSVDVGKAAMMDELRNIEKKKPCHQ